MTTTTRDRLARIQGRRTLYELAFSHPDGRRYLIGYSAGMTRRAIWDLCVRVAESLAALSGTDRIVFAMYARNGATIDEWSVRWTGRTEREAITAGEFPYVGA